MTERKGERQWATEIYGNSNTVENLGQKIAASIYHSVILHSPPGDGEFVSKLEKVLLKFTTKEELEKLRAMHKSQDEHSL